MGWGLLEKKKIKLHQGCGTVYLKDYINIDLFIEGRSFLASERPDLRRLNETTFKNYYKRKESRESLTKHPLQRFIVADRLLNNLEPDYPENSVDKIVIVQTFET